MPLAVPVLNVLRRLWPHLPIRRQVHGVNLRMPISHALPDYVRQYPQYGKNLLEIVDVINANNQCLHVIDVGGNIGDSALQILSVTDARILCVEGDPYWLQFLRTNITREHRIQLEASLLAAAPMSGRLGAIRDAGTTRFEPQSQGEFDRMITVAQLAQRHPQFERVDLIKSDTDGHDVDLVPALARQWASSKPILFFEYDPALVARVSDTDPKVVWTELQNLGYETANIWNNLGEGLAVLSLKEIAPFLKDIEEARKAGRYQYWDVAVTHGDDSARAAAISSRLLSSLRVPTTQ